MGRPQAEAALIAKGLNKEYLPITGLAEFTSLSAKLALGEKLAASTKVVNVQSISGTGALRVGAEFVNRFYKAGNRKVYMPNPTWGNHIPVFEDCGLPTTTYRYYDAKTCGLDINGMLEDLRKAPEQSIILLHACAHNPTGVDPTPAQWEQIAQVVQERHHLAFFDMAYQGFASGDPNRDAHALRLFVSKGLPAVFAQSYSKNFGLYGERVGNLGVIVDNAKEADAVDSQLKIIVRPMYSNPPSTGARIVEHVLADPKLHQQWYVRVARLSWVATGRDV